MAKVRIKKLPRGFKVSKGRLLKTMHSGGKTGDQTGYGLTTFPNSQNLSLGGDPFAEVNNTLGPVPRDEANLEAEKGETVLTDLNDDGAFEFYNIAGERHHSGGTPLNLPPQSFIYSDTASMKLNKDELLEMGINSKKKITPAKVSKNFDLNKYISVLNDPTSDHISIDTAEYMLSKNKGKLSLLAFLQEAKKGFEEGVPLAAYPYIQKKGMDPIQFSQQVQDISQQEAEAQALLQLPVDMQEKILQLKAIFKKIEHDKNPEKSDVEIANKQEANPTAGQGMPNMQPMPPSVAPGEEMAQMPEMNQLDPNSPMMAAYGRELKKANKGWWGKALDYTQGALTAAGTVFEPADWLNTGISAARTTTNLIAGNKDAAKEHAKNTALNLASGVPIVGNVAAAYKAGKTTKNIANAVDTGVDMYAKLDSAKTIHNDVTTGPVTTETTATTNPKDYQAPIQEDAPVVADADSGDVDVTSDITTTAAYGGDPFSSLQKFVDNNIDKYQEGEETTEEKADERESGKFQYSDNSEAVRNIMTDLNYNLFDMPDEGDIKGIGNQKGSDGYYSDEEATKNIITSEEGQKDFYERNKGSFSNMGIDSYEDYQSQYVGKAKDSDIVEQFQNQHAENAAAAFDGDEELRNKLIEQFGDEETARKAFMESMSFSGDGQGNPFGIDNKHGVYTHGVSDFSKKPDEIVCIKCGEDGTPISQVFNKSDGCGEGFVPEGSALDCGGEEEVEEQAVRTETAPAEPEFWLQDQLGLMNAIDNKFNLKKYYPWAPRIDAKEIDAVFEDPTREIAAIGEQAATAAMTATAFSGPQRAAAVQAKAQGVAAQQIADTMARVQGSNVKTANIVNSKNAELASNADIANKESLKKLYDDTIATEQNYDNALKEANAEITAQMQNMYTNRAYTHNLNQLYPEFNVHPQTGGLAMFDPTVNRDLTDSGRVGTTNSDRSTTVDNYLDMYDIDKNDLSADERLKLYNSQGVTTPGGGYDRDAILDRMNYPGGYQQGPNQTMARRGREAKKQRILRKGAELRNWFSPLRAMSKR